jgi:hypothetical protein
MKKLSRDEMKNVFGGLNETADCDGKKGSVCGTAANCGCNKGLVCDSGENSTCITKPGEI